MEDVLEVYKRPYDEKRPVVCMDESSKQLTKETTSTMTPISQCGAGTIFDEELNMCVLKVIPTHPKCGPGVLFDEENRKCIAP